MMIMQMEKDKVALVLRVISDMDKYFVRRMEISDIEVLKKIYSDSFDKQVSGDISYTKENIYVVCNEEKVLGMCMVDYIDDIFISKRTAYVNSVCIHKEYRGKGIATFMLREIEKIVIEDGSDEIMLTSSKERICANKLYEKLGFIIRDTNVYIKKL